jgi:GNAT superfamily N-acetyltransferase/catechol 2,3-dioxygenase-like lactoylglutathione lyase family enzyme
MLKRSEAIFAVCDIHETLAFYRDVLGFESNWTWGTPVGFGGARCGQVQVMFCLQPELAAKVEGHMHFFNCDDIESLHARHRSAGANIVSPIENKPWNVREYTVRDPNGYHLRFSGPMKYERPATATETMPGHIQITEGKPTRDEFIAIHESVGWGKTDDPTDMITRSLTCFLAIDTRTSTPIGMTRVMQDAIKWFSLWDVAVRPEYQGQRIGTALVETAVAYIKQRTPGAIVHLFTYKPQFYDRLEFKTENVTLRRL